MPEKALNDPQALKEALEAAWAEYKARVEEGGDPQTLYRERVWPLLLALWRAEPPVHPGRQTFALSIHTLGTSPEAAIQAILGTGAEEVYVFHTEETRRFLPRLREETGKEVYPLEIQKSDVAAIYRKVRELLEKRPEALVALDVTGGTKAMSAGLAAAGFFFQRFFPGVRVVYVDSGEYDVKLRRPRAGTERLIVLPNPHEVVGEVDALFAKELYAKEDYGGAARYFSGLVGKTGDQAYTLYAMLAEMYAAWQALDFKEAARKGQTLQRALEKDTWLQHPLGQHLSRLRRQVELLEAAAEFLSTKDLGKQRGVLGVAATLLHLSERTAKKQPVLAALYAYRALELLLQERLYRFDRRRAETPNLSPEEEAALRDELAALLPDTDEIRVGPKLGLLEVLAFLRVLGDPVLKKKGVKELQGLAGVLKARNQALLIHGLEVPSEKQVKQVQTALRVLLGALQEELAYRTDLKTIPLERV
ncbi:TIGR02710 family CRISPR-associated CARF protein [Marinithermus hydrothermalis]|uniref:CRISPR-associated protein, TIGR02710 family n=1 Tax=Marinithermus hydrothermalis (strain DSM 14884 / JCM 11576 / T1) TaxID=869210 RepID=F2NKI3_MARHT|nr:TIGR02710 family CRISPR-associated CARF protein [Marinithermus hydrothermalis]AEB12643.1 CRISPR-associated protein, TIGR02710 family [Marinithermus hydrothermalis DSM 14884]